MVRSGTQVGWELRQVSGDGLPKRVNASMYSDEKSLAGTRGTVDLGAGARSGEPPLRGLFQLSEDGTVLQVC